MKNLNITVVKNKGGVGATTISTFLTSVARSAEFPHWVKADKEAFKVAAYSADPENKHVLELFRGPGDPYTSIGLHNVNKQEGIDGILNVLEIHEEADIILTDFRANGLKFIGQITRDPETFFRYFEDAGFTNVVIVPLDGHPDSLEGFDFATSNYGKAPIYVAAHRSFESNQDDYSKSKNPNYYQLLGKVKKDGIRVVEWEVPFLSRMIEANAKLYRIPYLDEALIKTGSIPLADRGRFRRAVEEVTLLYRELYK